MNFGQDVFISKLLSDRIKNETRINSLLRKIEYLSEEKKKLEKEKQDFTKELRKRCFNNALSHEEAKRSQQFKNVHKMRRIFDEADAIIASLKIKIKSIRFSNIDDASMKPYDIIIDDQNDENYEKSPEYALFVVECLRLSRDQYNFIRQLMAPEWPTWYSLNLVRKRLDQEHVLYATNKGFYVDLKKTIHSKLDEYVKRTGYRRDEVFDVKLAMDGTNVGRKFKILNISFTLPSDKDKCLSASGNFSLGK
jgi:hypothetical protein